MSDAHLGAVETEAPAPAMSAQPCGCDAGANWICERHRVQPQADGDDGSTAASGETADRVEP